MDNGQGNDDGFGDESWDDDPLNLQARPSVLVTDATSESESDFSPAQVALMGRRISTHSAPLPRGVMDINWQAPESTGLQHSSPIFETESDDKGSLRISGKGLTSDNCHFRSWQEDNGVAATFATETVVKEVDGHRMTVAIGRGRRASNRTSSFLGAVSRTSTVTFESSGAADPDIERLRSLRRCSSEGEESRCDSAAELEREFAAGPSLPPTDDSSPSEVSSSPRRPADGVASSHSQQPRPGRWLSSTEDAVDDDEGASTLPRQEGAEAVRQPAPATVAGEACEPAVVGSEAGVEHVSSATGPTAEVGIGGEAGDQSSQQRQAEDKGGGHAGSQEESTPSPKVEEKRRTRWWGFSRPPRAPSPQLARHTLPAISTVPSSGEAPAKPRRWPSFRRHRHRAAGAG